MIVVVGAGLSGLACAHELNRLGVPHMVLEAASEPGGRVRSTLLEGFTLDHGFQVILSSYSALRGIVDIPSLQPRYFESGAILANSGETLHMANPLRHPGSIGETLTAFPLQDGLKLTRLVGTTLLTDDQDLLNRCGITEGTRKDLSTREFLLYSGFSNEFISRFATPFFGGVFLDEELSTSAGLFLYYLKKFASGTAWIPAAGVGAFPNSIARMLEPSTLCYNRPVESLIKASDRVTGVRMKDGSQIAAEAVVLALDIPSLEKLTGQPVSPTRSVSTVYFRTRNPLYSIPCLVLPGSGDHLVRHFCQVTNVAPELAPPEWHLVSATVLGSREIVDLEKRVKKEIQSIYPEANEMEHLKTIHIPQAVPLQLPGFSATTSPGLLGSNVFLAGDQGGASLQNALLSGKAAAKAAADVLS